MIHTRCPEAEETLKWGMPSFLYNERILAGMAAFKQHCAFGFWGGHGLVGNEDKRDDAMVNLAASRRSVTCRRRRS